MIEIPAPLPVDRDPAPRIYAGWRVVMLLFCCTFALFGSSIYSFIILLAPLAEQHGWSGTQTGSLVSAMWFVAPLALFSGSLVKHIEPWRLVVAGLLLQALGLGLLPSITEIWQLYLLRLAMGLGKVILITAVPVIVARWFSRRFATAIAIIWAGGAAGGLVMAPLTEILARGLGWTTAAAIVAVGVIAVGAVTAIIGKGLGGAMDDAAYADEFGVRPDIAPQAITGREVIRRLNPAIAGLMMLAVMGIGMASIAALTQAQALFEGAGIAPPLAATYLGILAGGSLAGAALIGFVLDRYPARWSGLIVAASIYCGILSFGLVSSAPHSLAALIASISFGFGCGAGEVLWIALTKRQFGTPMFATTYGGWYFALQAGYAAGGGLAGWGFESFGPWGFLLLVAAVYAPATLLSIVLAGARRRPGLEA